MQSFTLRSVSLDRKERFEIGRQLERDYLSKDGFFSKGVTTACLKRKGNVPGSRERFTIVVKTRMFTHSLSSEDGTGSRSHCLSGDFRIILLISS